MLKMETKKKTRKQKKERKKGRKGGREGGKEGGGGERIGEDYKGASLLRKYFFSYPPVIL